jgi:hypothetical protein
MLTRVLMKFFTRTIVDGLELTFADSGDVRPKGTERFL